MGAGPAEATAVGVSLKLSHLLANFGQHLLDQHLINVHSGSLELVLQGATFSKMPLHLARKRIPMDPITGMS